MLQLSGLGQFRDWHKFVVVYDLQLWQLPLHHSSNSFLQSESGIELANGR